MIIVGIFTLGLIILMMYLVVRYLTEDETKKPHKKTKLAELEALSEVEDSLKEEIGDLQKRADVLEWASLEKIFKLEGYNEEDLALEKEMFDCMQRVNACLVNYAKKK